MPFILRHMRELDDQRLAGVLAGALALVAVWMLRVWGWGVPTWQDLPSVRLDLALHGSEAALAIRAEALEPADETNQVRIFHEANEGVLLEGYPLSSTLALDGLAVVPGLANTRSWDALQEAVTVSRHMVPQGIAVSGRWVFVSAYDGARDANSVVYLIDRQTGELAKTVVLSGQPHVGGLAYDDDHDRLWVCSKRGTRAQLVGIDLARIMAYDEGSAEPILYDATVVIRGPKRASFVEYFGGSLYVGFFNATANGALYRYLLDDEGTLTRESAEEPVESYPLPPKAQGAAVTEERVLISLSHGKTASELLVFARDTTYDHMASLPEHGGHVVYGEPPEGPGAGEGSGSAGSLAAGMGSASETPGDEGGEGPSLPNPFEGLEELLPFIFGEPGGRGESADQDGPEGVGEMPAEGSEGSVAGAGITLGHTAFAEGLALMAADRAAIRGTLAVGLAAQAGELASSGERNVVEPASYATDPLLSCELPPMLEDLTIRDGLLFAVHESGATVYRNRYGVGVDRVTCYPVSLLDEALVEGVQRLEFPDGGTGSAGGGEQ